MGLRGARLGAALVVAAAACIGGAPAAGAATLAPGDILAVNYQTDPGIGAEGIIKIDRATGKLSLISSNGQPVNSTSGFFSGPWDLMLMPNGELMVSNGSGNGVIGVNPLTGKQRVVSDNAQSINSSNPLFSFPTGIVRMPNGDLAVGNSSSVGIVRVDPSNGRQSVLSSNDQPINVGTAYYSGPYDLTAGPGGSLIVSDSTAFGDGGLISVNPATGKQTKLSANDQAINASSQLFLDPASAQLYRGKLYVANGGADQTDQAGVVAVDPATGKQTVVSSNGQPINSSSGYFDNVYGIAIEPGGRILVSDETTLSDGAILTVNPASGKQSLLAANSEPPNVGTSELLNYPDGIMVVPPKCGGLYPTIVGTSAKDKIKGTPFRDIIVGLGGSDTIRGLGAADILCGGPGPDLLIGGGGKDRLLGAAGRDRLRGGPGRDVLNGGPGRDRERQ